MKKKEDITGLTVVTKIMNPLVLMASIMVNQTFFIIIISCDTKRRANPFLSSYGGILCRFLWLLRVDCSLKIQVFLTTVGSPHVSYK